MHIKQLEKNKYRVWIDLESDYSGKRRQKSKVFHASTKRDLNKQINEWVESISGISSQCRTVSDLCNAVWSQVINNKSKNTIRSYNDQRKRIDDTIGLLRLEKLTPRTLQMWVDDLSSTLSPRTIRFTYSLLRNCCSIAVTWNLIKTNPCHDVSLPSVRKKEVQILTPEDFTVFCSHLDELPLDYKVCFELALFGTLRKGEVLGIMEDEIPDDGRFYIKRARYSPNLGEVFVKETKTSSGERLCILPQLVVDDVIALRKQHIQSKLKYGKAWVDSPYLLKEENGEAFHACLCITRLQSYMKKIGLEPITFHALRHTYASICISLGVNPEIVSKRMGHSNISTTLGIYTHLFEQKNNDDEIASALGTMLSQSVEKCD